MSMAEVIPVHEESHQAISVAMPAMPQARARISADAFKNLTARLKHSGNSNVAASVSPVPVPTVKPTVYNEPVAQAIEVAPHTAIVAPAVEPQVAVFEPPSVADALTSLESAVPAVAEISEANVYVAPAVAEVLQQAPVTQSVIQPLTQAVEVTVAARTVVLEPAVQPAKPAFPELINPLEIIARQEAERAAEDARLQAEAEAKALLEPPPPPRDPEMEARALAELAEARTIENIWRQILATPTSDDKSAYLRDARELMGDEAMHPPEAEHDLSRIEPAAEAANEPVAGVAPDEEPAEQPAEAAVIDEEKSAVSIPVLLESGHQDTAEFARSLLDMMAAGASSGLPHERALAADTLLRILPRLDLKPLVMLSQRIAMMDNPPNLIVAKLIRDPRVEVSGPLLEDCMHMTDQDLAMVIEENQPDKLRMIARRRRMTRAISDVLIKTDDPSVMLTLVRNMDAEISHDGFNTLIEATDRYPDLLAPLSTRPDLGAPFAFELFWHAPAQLRRFLLTRFLTDSETLTKILKITMATKDEEEHSEIEPMSQHVILEALDRATRGKLEPAADELAAALQISSKTVMRILTDDQGEPMVILLKAANYARSAMPGLLRRLQDGDFPVISLERDPEELQSMFETLSFNKARILLTYWDWAMTKTGPYAPVH
jgi:Uncharacterised protein conserved in bacteria (DUF2336)